MTEDAPAAAVGNCCLLLVALLQSLNWTLLQMHFCHFATSIFQQLEFPPILRLRVSPAIAAFLVMPSSSLTLTVSSLGV